MKISHKTDIVYNKGFGYYFMIIIKFLFNISMGIGSGILLYFKCLQCQDCNNIVVIYLAIISFAGLSNLGLPFEKFVKIDSLTK